ncbi:CD1375 family protein [Bacillus infantis]
METIYYTLVKAGRREIDQVPEHLRDKVQAMLDADQTSN